MKIIKFTGSQKKFFKAFPMEKRSFDVIYELTNSTGTKYYRFLDTLGEKNFKHWKKPIESNEQYFDLTYLDDLPEKLKSYLFFKYDKKRNRNKNEVRLVSLFNMADRPLTISELMVGFYRVNKVYLKRSKITVMLNRMTNIGILTRVKTGLYQLNRKH